MEKQVEIHAYHGWGFDASFWDPLKAVIPKKILFKAANRGYFGDIYYPRFDSRTKFKVVFTHSYGLHWCNTAVLSKADYLIIMNGFGEFIPCIRKDGNHAPEKALELTIKAFSLSPAETLATFRQRVFAPQSAPPNLPSDIQMNRAVRDLKSMRKVQFPIIDLDFGAVMIALDSSKDRILMHPRGSRMLKEYVGPKHMKVFENAGHALPYVLPEECWSYLCSVIPIFRNYENYH